MPLIPRLVLHQEATALLVEEPADDNEVEPLNRERRMYIDMGSDDYEDEESPPSESSSDEDDDDSSEEDSLSDNGSIDDDSSENVSSLFLDEYDIEAIQAVYHEEQDEPTIALGSTTAHGENGSLFYQDDEAHSFGKANPSVGLGAVRPAIVVNKTIKGAEVLTKQAVKTTGKVTRQAAKTTRKAAKQTVKTTRKAAKQTAKTTRKAAKKTGKVAKQTAKVTEKAVKHTANAAIGLPHELPPLWQNLVALIMLFPSGSVALSMITAVIAMTQAYVDDGLAANRLFLYVGHTISDICMLSPFIATCHYAVPEAKIPVITRIWSLLVGAGTATAIRALIAETNDLFPIPFSFIVSMVTGVPALLLSQWCFTPKRNDPVVGEKVRNRLLLCYLYLANCILSFIMACLWAKKFLGLSHAPIRQTFWSLFYQVMEFFFKIVVSSNITTRLNSRKWLELNLVVDMIFASVQISMLPYFSNWSPVIFTAAGMAASQFWRTYGGVDRLQQFLPNAIAVIQSSEGLKDAVKEMFKLGFDLAIMRPANDIKPLSVRLNGRGADQGLPEWDVGDDSDDEKGMERSDTLETESNDSDSVDLQESISSEPIDRRAAFRNQGRSQLARQSGLHEVRNDQRRLFHIVDSCASPVMIVVVRLCALLSALFIRYIPDAAEHVNASFQTTEEQWKQSLGFAGMFIFAVLITLALEGCYLRKSKSVGGLTLLRIIAYIFRDNYWFFFLWFLFAQHCFMSLQLNHFGSDITLTFEWLRCPGFMEWPGCMILEPS